MVETSLLHKIQQSKSLFMIKKHPHSRAERLELDKKYSLKKTRGVQPLEDKEYVGAIPETSIQTSSISGGQESPPWLD